MYTHSELNLLHIGPLSESRSKHSTEQYPEITRQTIFERIKITQSPGGAADDAYRYSRGREHPLRAASTYWLRSWVRTSPKTKFDAKEENEAHNWKVWTACFERPETAVVNGVWSFFFNKKSPKKKKSFFEHVTIKPEVANF
jgi:hypothetical protein